MRSTFIREVHANLVAQKRHDDTERYAAGIEYARRVQSSDAARMAVVQPGEQRH
jgi:hypothetical protein